MSKIVSKGAGRGMLRSALTKAAGPLFLAGTAISAVQGAINADEIMGKDKQDLTVGDYSQAMGAQMFSNMLTFGLVSPQQAVKLSNDIADFIVGNRKQNNGSLTNTAVFQEYITDLSAQQQINNKFNTAKSDIANSLTGNDPSVLTGILNASTPRAALSNIEQNLFTNTGDSMQLNREAFNSMSKTQRMAVIHATQAAVSSISNDFKKPITRKFRS